MNVQELAATIEEMVQNAGGQVDYQEIYDAVDYADRRNLYPALKYLESTTTIKRANGPFGPDGAYAFVVRETAGGE